MSDVVVEDLRQVGISDGARAILERLKEHGHIAELLDGYRLGIATAVAFGRTPRATRADQRRTIFSSGGLDPDQWLRTVIVEIHPESRGWPYRAAEDLAEQGLEILEQQFDGEDLWLGDLIERIQQGNAAPTSVSE